MLSRSKKYRAFHTFNRKRRLHGLPTMKLMQWEALQFREAMRNCRAAHAQGDAR